MKPAVVYALRAHSYILVKPRHYRAGPHFFPLSRPIFKKNLPHLQHRQKRQRIGARCLPRHRAESRVRTAIYSPHPCHTRTLSLSCTCVSLVVSLITPVDGLFSLSLSPPRVMCFLHPPLSPFAALPHFLHRHAELLQGGKHAWRAKRARDNPNSVPFRASSFNNNSSSTP